MAGGNVTLQLEGVEELKRALRDAGTYAVQALAASGYELLSEIVEDAAENAPKDTGILKASAFVAPPKVRGYRVEIEGGFGGQAKEYAVVMELGRRPGAKRPPVEPIKEWARRHGIDEGMAFVIAKNIGIRGIAGKHFLENAFVARIPRMGQDLAEGVRVALQRLQTGR